MKTIYSFALLASLSLTASAQDSFDALDLGAKDLAGTARYVSMGGALSALGGDVSVMHVNPAGIGLYKRNDFAVGVSLVSVDQSVLYQNKSKLNFDYIGAVFSYDNDGDEPMFINFGIGVKNNRNFFNNIGTTVGGFDKYPLSQTYQIANYANDAQYLDDWSGFLADMAALNTTGKDAHPGILDSEENAAKDAEGNPTTKWNGIPAQAAEYYRSVHGSNTVWDLNVSLNLSDRWFIGAGLGFSWLNMTRESAYSEVSVDGYQYMFENMYETTGYGFDVKLGAIVRPFEDSPFRIGVNWKSPTSYRLTDRNSSTLFYDMTNIENNKGTYSKYSSDYEYDYSDPWSLGVSLGYTIGKNFAIGAEYEYQDFSNAKYTSLYSDDEQYFRDMNKGIMAIGKSQHTYKIGAEFKPVDNVSLRLGYNYITSPYELTAVKGLGYDSPHTETDWVNWKDIQRICAGLGFRFNKCYLDVAYQYQMQKGDFYAFNIINDNGEEIYFPPTEIKANRSRLHMTFGVKF